MQLLIIALLFAVGSIPIGLIAAWIRLRHHSRRLAELELDLRVIQAQLADERRKAAEAQRIQKDHLSFPVVQTEEKASSSSSLAPSTLGVPVSTGGHIPRSSKEVAALLPNSSVQAQTPPTPQKLPESPSLGKGLPIMVDWEKFLGVKLFAWIGGLALFLGIAFFVKYSFERNLISPYLRICIGYGTAVALLLGGILLRRQEYAVTAQSLCATGVLALYGVTFAAHSLYQLFGSASAFLIMIAVTFVALILSVRLDARVISVLGIIGGFLTPPLLSQGADAPATLFGYVLLLNSGILAVALWRQWHFLLMLASICTALTELAWLTRFFEPWKGAAALTIFFLFNLFYLIALLLGVKRKEMGIHFPSASVIQAMLTFFLALFLLKYADPADHPALLLMAILAGDLAFVALVTLRSDLIKLHLLAGSSCFLILTCWINSPLFQPHFPWGLGAVVGFSMLHTGFPLILQRWKGLVINKVHVSLFPLIALGMMLLVTLQSEGGSLLVWPAVLLLDLLIIGIAVAFGNVWVLLGGLALTMLVNAVWIGTVPLSFSPSGTVFLTALFSATFSIAGLWFRQRLSSERRERQGTHESQALDYLPVASALLPFVLLLQMISRMQMDDPSPIFALGMALAVFLLWLGKRTEKPELFLTALGASLLLQYFWLINDFRPAAARSTVLWGTSFYFLFLLCPSIAGSRSSLLPWITAALSGPLSFYLLYSPAQLLWSTTLPIGLLPAALAVPSLWLLWQAYWQDLPTETKTSILAWTGGSVLFFITLIFPVQFQRQWLTLGWALEGVALLWLYHRVAHRGLPIVGIALLVVAFIRLGLNPEILSYYPRSETRLFNWYLYSYGVVVAALFVGGRLLAPPKNIVLEFNAPPLLFTLGTLLSFILLNIQIADLFGTGPHLRFDFSENFARDMTYSIGWALFGLILLVIGISRQLPAARYASLALLTLTLLKLFFHDLNKLDQGYRIGAFIGVALILISASWFYQRYLASTQTKPL